jgi:hypothetical protein
MPYKLNVAEKEVLGKAKYKDDKGHTECAIFVRQATGAPATDSWKKGIAVEGAKAGVIARGTAIATFDGKGKYPSDGKGKHAAIYLSHTADAITVLDQWNSQGEVKQRPIRFKNKTATSRSNQAETFYVIE